ncbi:MAG: hypothetical protein Q9173_003905 [Seirophora scorigena]
MRRSTVAVSAPGKVLLAGGYLVLDRDHTGLVFGLDARIHVHVQKLPTSPGVVLSEIIVRSPQFNDAEWRYGYRETEDQGGIEVVQLKGADFGSTSITIVADTDYYSHPGSKDCTSPTRFVNFNVPLSEAHKTGLGSSAALVTAFTSAVLTHYLDQSQLTLNSESGRACLHNIAQAAHCVAQGKVGSGFDVAAAVYGSCVYRRFSSSVLMVLGEVGSAGFSKRLRAVVEDSDPSNKWDMRIDKSAAVMPHGVTLLMCDVDCGSESVGMAKKVLAWRKENHEEAMLLWATLQKGNEDLARELQRLTQGCNSIPPDYKNLGDIILTIRSLIREMSAKAKVPIEPTVQTELLDACCQIDGVVGGVVPGAGGFDAIALLVRDKALPSLQEFLRTYSTTNKAESGPVIGKVKLLGVKQEMEGLRMEEANMYADWVR